MTPDSVMVVKIDNGFLIQHPVRVPKIKNQEQLEALQQAAQQRMVTYHCKNFDEVTAYLKKHWDD